MIQCMCMNQNTFFSPLHAVAVCRQAHLIALLIEWKQVDCSHVNLLGKVSCLMI